MATLASVKKAIEAKESFLERMKSIATFNIVSHMELKIMPMKQFSLQHLLNKAGTWIFTQLLML